MRILLLTHAFNSLTQRLGAELQRRCHEISIEFDIADSVTEERLAQVAFDAPAAGTSLGASVGELAEVELQLPPTPSLPVLPNASIGRQQGKTGVWRIENGQPIFVPVQVGDSSLGGLVQVVEGLKAGDRVVVYSHKALVPGARIQIVDALIPGPAQGSTP